MDTVSELLRELGSVLELFGVVEVDLDQDAEEDVNLRDDLLHLLLLAVLRLRRLAVYLHLRTARAAEEYVLATDGDQKLLGNISGGNGCREALGNGLGDDIGCQALADGGNRPQGSEGESGIEERDCAVQQSEIALDVCRIDISQLSGLSADTSRAFNTDQA